MNAYKPSNSRTYYVRFQFQKRNIVRQTYQYNRRDALKYGKQLRAKLALEAAAPLKTQPLAKSCTFMELMIAYRQFDHNFRNTRTLEQNCTRFQKYIEIAGRKNICLTDAVSLLCVDLAHEFRRNAKAQQIEPATANSYIQAAQSFTCQQLRTWYDAQRLEFDHASLVAFNQNQQLFSLPAKAYRLPSAQLLETTLRMWSLLLSRDDPPAHMAIWLALSFGLRRAEIEAARWNWLMMRDAKLFLTTDYIAKNGQEIGELACITHSKLWSHIYCEGEVRNDEAHMISDRQCFDRVGRWMEGLGWKTRNKIHEFRAYAGSQVARQDGIYAACRWLRHSSVTTTERYYAKYVGNLAMKTRIEL